MDTDANESSANVPTTLPHSDASAHNMTEVSAVQGDTQSFRTFAKFSIDRVLRFLSTASNEALGACVVGLGAATYLVLGRVGLVVIGVVGGVLLHNSWESAVIDHGKDGSQAQHSSRRKEIGLEVANRVLSWRQNIAKGQDTKEDPLESKPVSTGRELDYSDFGKETAAALTELTDAVVRDYVYWWYSPILPGEESFPTSCRRTLTAFIYTLSTHVSRKRPADTFLDFLTNSSSTAIVFLNELSGAFTASPNAQAEEALNQYLHSNPQSSLANILDISHQQRKLRMVADDILDSYLEPKTYNCEAAHVFLKQVFAQLVLESTLQRCSQSDFINGWLVYLLEDGEPDLMNAIDVGVEKSAPNAVLDAKNPVAEYEKMQKAASNATERENAAKHRRTVSKAQEAMDDAIEEAKRLTQLIAEEEAKRLQEQQHASTASLSDAISDVTTHGVATPSSSQSDSYESNHSHSPRNSSMEGSRGEPIQQVGSHATSARSTFTDFDQLVPRPEVISERTIREAPPLTLHHAKVSIFDDSIPGERSSMKSKPIIDYLIQIEPSSAQHTGWMIARKYADFETLHEVLRLISVIAGVGFTEYHANLPSWKGCTKTFLREELERYLNDALRFQPLAESEGMKRFLEKDDGQSKGPNSNKAGKGWQNPPSFESMGKGMIDALAKAPKEVAGGGKALIGGVTGVLGGVGNLGQKRPSSGTASLTNPAKAAIGSRTKVEDYSYPSNQERNSQESIRRSRSGPTQDIQPVYSQQAERQISHNSLDTTPSRSSSVRLNSSTEYEASTASKERTDPSADLLTDQSITLPPPPSEMPDDYDSSGPRPQNLNPSRESAKDSQEQSLGISAVLPSVESQSQVKDTNNSNVTSKKPTRAPKPPMTEQETQVAVELLFALISELYTLSSAWNIRRTLLNAAKTFLLRPGNPQLENIRVLLQETVIEANTSDEGIAALVRKIRENAVPTEAELKAWPPPPTEHEKVILRDKAKKLLMERGMPQALTSVMGAAASGEALGKVFDCLQIEHVARGLMFGLLLQALRAITQ